MLISLRKFLPVATALLSLILGAGCACSSGSSRIADRYAVEKVPEYQLVDTRFSSGNLNTHLEHAKLEKEMVCLFYKMGCQVNVVHREEGVTQIEFSRPEAKGKLVLQAGEHGADAHALNACAFTYRVNIANYPSTTDQDYHVNRIADELASSLRDADPITRAVAGNQCAH
ncbi:MAG: hypothetical protein PHP44_05255 [Kiritimatiellae bacterium]|nr:hypothetical protein [Kiritimatiellia bacterium]